jgi:hypothetical protein
MDFIAVADRFEQSNFAHGLCESLGQRGEITGLPRDNFEVREITKEEFETFRP